MLVQKRSKMRKELRTEQLRARFALERKTLLQGRNSVFQELTDATREGGGQYDLSIRVLRCAERFPQEENSYILIGNRLIEQPLHYQYFQHFLTAAPRRLQHYLWCLQLLLFYYLEGERSQEKEEKLRGIAQVLQQLGKDMRETDKTGRPLWEELDRTQRMHKLFVVILKDLIDSGLYVEELREPIRDALAMISSINYSETQELGHSLEFLVRLQKQWELVQGRLEDPFTRAFMKICLNCLRNLRQQREECIELLQFLLLCCRESHAITQLPLKELIGELLYLLGQQPSLQPNILRLLQVMLQESRIQELSLMLELQVHVILTKGMQSAMREHNNRQLEDCLAGLYRILNKLATLEEKRLLQRVKNDIQAEDFHLMVEGLLHNEQNAAIGGLVNNIVDDLYSEEVEEHV